MSSEEHIFLPTAGSIPGIPGSHGAGDYLVDWDARTVRAFEEAQPEQPAPVAEETAPVQEAPAEQPIAPESATVAEELAHVEEELHTLEAEQPQA